MIIFENNLRQNLFKPKRTKLKHFYQFPPGACLRTPQVNLQKKLLPPPPAKSWLRPCIRAILPHTKKNSWSKSFREG